VQCTESEVNIVACASEKVCETPRGCTGYNSCDCKVNVRVLRVAFVLRTRCGRLKCTFFAKSEVNR
jgi:hypothetical protein